MIRQIIVILCEPEAHDMEVTIDVITSLESKEICIKQGGSVIRIKDLKLVDQIAHELKAGGTILARQNGDAP